MTCSSGDCGIDPSAQAVNPDEVKTLLTWIETDLEELPILGTSESILNTNLLNSWCAAVETAVREAGPHLNRWWSWTVQEAGRCILLRDRRIDEDTFGATAQSILATSIVPALYMHIETCMQPRLLRVLPVFIQEWGKIRTQEGEFDPSHFLVFYAQVSSIQDQGNLYEEEDWKRLVHAVVQTTSRGELQQASDDVQRWVHFLSDHAT